MSRAFRIEKFMGNHNVQDMSDGIPSASHSEIMQAITDLRDAVLNNGSIEGVSDAAFDAQRQVQEEELKQKQLELIRVKDEMRAIYQAIDDTKRQILTIKESGTNGDNISRAAEELSAIVKGTEEATNKILHSAEVVETNSSNLVAMIKEESQQALACEIQDNVVNIFEACNFQDLTGQRITKVVKTFCFIEQRIYKMMEIWGGAEGFLDVTPEELEYRQGDGALLNGPSLEEDSDVASQDDIDALFD